MSRSDTRAPDAFQKILIYTDGACSGNPGPGGWASVIAYPEGQIKELGGYKSQTTNNEMEIMAALRALVQVRNRNEDILLYSDSVYLIRGITQWIWGWRKKGWKTAEGHDVSNRELWKKLAFEVMDRKSKSEIEWKYSRGHRGIAGNERCDEIAVAFSQKKAISLYEGPLLKYSVAVYDLPPDEPLPEMKPKAEKGAAFSYLSFVGREVYRHQSWSSCERRVKGQSGAKFKKAVSAEDEKSILSAWGLPADYPIKSAD
jgi:ribonuclease HI